MKRSFYYGGQPRMALGKNGWEMLEVTGSLGFQLGLNSYSLVGPFIGSQKIRLYFSDQKRPHATFECLSMAIYGSWWLEVFA